MKEIFEKLQAPFPDEAIQRTRGNETGKNYDTTGYGYQYIIDRFNEILGFDWMYSWRIVHQEEGEYSKSQKKNYQITVETTIIVFYEEKEIKRSCVGGHTAANYADALKGAITNSLKKTAAFYGVGADAYRGEIDDDNKPVHENYRPEAYSKVNFDEIKKDIAQLGFNDLIEYKNVLWKNNQFSKSQIDALKAIFAAREKDLGSQIEPAGEFDF